MSPANSEPVPAASLSPVVPRPISAPVDPTSYPTVARLSMADTSAMAFAGLGPSSNTITIDAGFASGGHNSGPEPKELLLLSLGSCTGMDVISILRKKRQQVTQYSVNVHATEATTYPKVYTTILVEHIVGGRSVDPAAVARSIELSITKYCPVHAMLSNVVPIEHVYRVFEDEAE
jgi:putative redox protein